MSKIRPQDLIFDDNCVTVPYFFTPRAKAAQVRMQLANPAMIISAKNIMRCGIPNLKQDFDHLADLEHPKKAKTH